MIIAVVVTYNRLDKLKNCLASLQAQTHPLDAIIVVDNNSTDGTKEFLDKYVLANTNIFPVHLDKNIGGAGGFKKGIELAAEKNASWVWLMDDDCECNPDSLFYLCKYQAQLPQPLGFLCSTVFFKDYEICQMNVPFVNHNFNEYMHLPGQPIAVNSCSFVSCLISVQAIRDVGLPLAEFFIWYDDVEYTRRISKKKYMNFMIWESVTHHRMEKNVGAELCHISPANIWKYIYGHRNLMSMRFYGGGIKDKVWCFIELALTQARLYKAKKPFKLRWQLFFAEIKGMLWDYRKHISHLHE